MNNAWQGFKQGRWTKEIDVRGFIQANYTPYEGDSSFLAGATENTTKLWDEVLELFKKERQASGCRYRKSRGYSKRIIPRYFRIAC